MDKKELYKRVLAELRDLGSGESLSVVGLAEEMGEPDSVIADVLEILHRHNYAWCSGRGCYSPSPKCRKATTDEIMSELGGCTTEKPRPEPEPVKEDHATQELRPSADRVCRFCGKVLEPNKLRRHENMCGKNPDRPHTPPKFLKKAEPKEEAVEVPAPAEYAEAESNATATLEHEVGLLFVPNPDHCTGCLDYNRADGTCMVNCVTEESCNHAYRPREPQLQDVPSVDEILGQQQASEDPDVPDEIPVHVQDVLVLKGSPGMSAALRLLSYCQRAVAEGADLSLHANLKVAEGLYVSIDLELPVGQDGEVEPVE